MHNLRSSHRLVDNENVVSTLSASQSESEAYYNASANAVSLKGFVNPGTQLQGFCCLGPLAFFSFLYPFPSEV